MDLVCLYHVRVAVVNGAGEGAGVHREEGIDRNAGRCERERARGANLRAAEEAGGGGTSSAIRGNNRTAKVATMKDDLLHSEVVWFSSCCCLPFGACSRPNRSA